ncbi:MAG: gamma-glutamyltransferase [Gammaproteobacteria bacterium]|nr:gamma-glutamyltransferase [Gammaproteobacteria bacterium]
MSEVGIATTSQIAADAAAEIAALGGNAVDCGIAASFCSINTQPGVCALAGGAFVTIWHPDESPITIDGNVAVPGMGLPPETRSHAESVSLEYGGGITTLVGASSVATPGTLAALFLASQRYGCLPWRELVQPTIRAICRGFPLASACHYFLSYAGDVIYGRSADGHGAMHDETGALLDAGAPIFIPHLADSLEAIAEEGDRVFYEGEIARKLIDHVSGHGGRLTMEDLRNYSPDVRDSLLVDVGQWQIGTNPLPAIGGVNLAAMLHCFGTDPIDGWSHENLRRLIQAQDAVMSCRQQTLDSVDEVGEPAMRMLELAKSGELIPGYASGSTVHTSSVDNNGLACAITASSGYGSGEMPPDTGLWLNNCLGELELNRHGLNAGPPGKRLPSNMAPGCARSPGKVLAFGSPGADRITTALHQFLANFLQRGLDLGTAIALPRIHLKIDGTLKDVAYEPGIEMPDIDFDVTRFDALNMYFGGVVAALYDNGDFEAAADPRREGGTIITRR